MKYCTDCFWMKLTKKQERICTRPTLLKINPVNGHSMYPGCAEQRETRVYGLITWLIWLCAPNCGPDAKYFSPLTPTSHDPA